MHGFALFVERVLIEMDTGPGIGVSLSTLPLEEGEATFVSSHLQAQATESQKAGAWRLSQQCSEDSHVASLDVETTMTDQESLLMFQSRSDQYQRRPTQHQTLRLGDLQIQNSYLADSFRGVQEKLEKMQSRSQKLEKRNIMLLRENHHLKKIANEKLHLAQSAVRGLMDKLEKDQRLILQQDHQMVLLESKLRREESELEEAKQEISTLSNQMARQSEELTLVKQQNGELAASRESERQLFESMRDQLKTMQDTLHCLQETKVEQPPSLRNSVLDQTKSLWEKNLRPHFDEVMELMSPRKLIDKLYTKRLLDRDEYIELSNKQLSEKEKAGKILLEILPKKGRDAFTQFCAVLRQVEDQRAIADLIDTHIQN